MSCSGTQRNKVHQCNFAALMGKEWPDLGNREEKNDTERGTERETDREKERQKYRKTQRQTDREEQLLPCFGG